MSEAVRLVEVLRGGFVESAHLGHALVCDAAGEVVAAWGDPARVTLPRSACKMLQALPVVESGAADRAGLGPEHLALACASHEGGAAHVQRVAAWLGGLGLSEADLRCGPQEPGDAAEREALRATGAAPCQLHNNCSGKHAGFLTLGRETGGGPEYVEPGHPVQRAVREAIEELIGETSPGYGIDGCSAPNFAGTLQGFAAAMARFAAAETALKGARREAAIRLRAAMLAHPFLVAGEGRACTEIMEALGGSAVIKTGAEGVFFAMLPGKGLGVALKIEDGATRASECAMAALLVRLGVAEAADPAVRRRLMPDLANRAGRPVGAVRPAEGFWQGGARL
ncbi:MAG TPA: asparaginase [Paracoccaceae bacterium]|nr:asparaginase [Paracoccaceae bacterium]